MSMKCDVCEVVDEGAELFRCDVCETVYCAKCLMRYADALETVDSGGKIDKPGELLEILNSCPGCKALTLELHGDDEECAEQPEN